MQKIFIFLITLMLCCSTTSKVPATHTLEENNKDVVVLAMLIRDHLKRTHERDFNLQELVKKDSLKRIFANFENTELKFRGGYISVYYKFSASRNSNFELSETEKAVWKKWTAKKIKSPFDGEIRFAYGERFYHIKKIIVKKEKRS